MATPDPTHDAAVLGMYRLHAPIYDLTRWAFLRGRKAAVDRSSLRAGQSVLEVGCGTGGNLVRLCRQVGESGEVHGLDLSPHMLAQARRKVRRARWRNVVLHEQEATRYDLGRRFDAILYSYSLSMLPEWQRSLESAARHLAPGGRLVVVDFAQMDRPVGPPNDHVLSLDEARASVTGMGLRELAVHEPGAVGRYQIAIVGEKPPADGAA